MSKPLAKKLKPRMQGGRRRAISVSQQALVRTGPLFPEGYLPLLVEPAVKDGVDLLAWARDNRDSLAKLLLEHGGLLFRGFDLTTVPEFERFIEAVSDRALEYRERSSPRTRVQGNVYTSTDYPSDQAIFLHNENSYQRIFPRKIFFFCVTPAETEGATPIADCRKVLQRISPEIQANFSRRQWMYRRNFGEGVGLPWRTVFQTDDRSAVEEYCRGNGIEVEWKDGDCLCTSAVRPAISRPPNCDELTWFNHATIFHITTRPPAVRDALLSQLAEEDLPSNSYYGDGSAIEEEVLEQVRAAYHQETVRFSWQRHDILMLDNMLVAHGREPFTGERKIVVGMAEPTSWDEVESPEISS